MPYKERTVGKLYWTIGEVASELGVNTSTIRYWEKEFGTVRPKRTERGDRHYTGKDIEQLKRIQHLLKEKGFTLQGAKDQLRTGAAHAAPGPIDRIADLRERLLAVRKALVVLRNKL